MKISNISIVTIIGAIVFLVMLVLTIIKFDYLTIDGKFTVICVLLGQLLVTLLSHKYCSDTKDL